MLVLLVLVLALVLGKREGGVGNRVREGVCVSGGVCESKRVTGRGSGPLHRGVP